MLVVLLHTNDQLINYGNKQNITTVYSNCTGQSASSSTCIKNCRILLKQNFTAHISMLTSTSTFVLVRHYSSSQWC